VSALSKTEDKRAKQGMRFSLQNLGLCLLTATLAGCWTQREIAAFLSGHWENLKGVFSGFDFSSQSESAPSQSTVSRILSQLDFHRLMQAFHEIRRERLVRMGLETPHYAFDGKARKGCVSEATGRTETDLSCFCTQTKEVLGIVHLKDKQGEATAAANFMKSGGSV
jgi:hypothetical protein